MKYSRSIAMCAMFVVASVAQAGVIDTTNHVDGDLDATAVFTDDGAGNLVVTLTNSSTADVTKQIELLQGVFFTIRDGGGAIVNLGAVSAIVAGGSTVEYEPAMFADGGGDPGDNVGGEFAYRDEADVYHADPVIGEAHMGISAVGLDVFGPGDRFDVTRNLQGPTSPNGAQYGITSAGDDLMTGQMKVTGEVALIQNSVVFTLSGLAGGMTGRYTIEDVYFQYGTSFPEGTPEIPEPATMTLIGMGLLGLAARRRRTV